ncbi:MAG: lipopolysaccharide transport periplasmic protein LptA [Brachymonas sp.]
MPKHLSAYPWLAIFVLGGILPLTAQAAGRADQAQPMHIESDSLQYEDGNQRSVFTGSVNLKKGSIIMRGLRLEVRQDAAGNQLGTLTGSAQAPASFRQKREGGNDEYVEAQAATITYNSATAIVTLTGQARFTRLQGSQTMDTVTGQVIVYNSNSDIFSVNGGGGVTGSSQATGGAGRVRVTLSTRSGADETVAGKPTDERARIKPSLQLESGSGQ